MTTEDLQSARDADWPGRQGGAALVMVILAILLVAGIGAAVLSVSSTSTILQVGSVDNLNAYALAETGRNYALTYIVPEKDAGGNPNTSGTGTMALLNNKTFTLPSGLGQFKLQLSHANCPGSTCVYTLVSTGMPSANVKRTVTYLID